MSDYIIAVDPGKMTGWARLMKGTEFLSGETDLYDFLFWTHESLDQGLQPVIVCEDFIYTPETAKKTRQTYSTEAIGVLRYFSQRYNLPFHLQSPAEGKSFGTDKKLKMLDWWVPGKGHANDAARHLLVYAAGNGLVRLSDVLQ